MNKATDDHKPRETPPSEFADLQDLIKATGLTSRELGPLFKTSNQTVLSWAHGREPKQEVLRLYAIRVMRLLRKIVEAGDLPLRGDVPHKDRARILGEVWRKWLAAPEKKEQNEG